jgi:hypothetical protein
MTTSEILLRAADRVQFQGWTQDALARDAVGNTVVDGKTINPWDPTAAAWCAGGAILAEVGNWTGAWPAINALNTELDSLTGCSSDIVKFNNAPDRTAGEVADMMRRAAKRLDNETAV